MEPLDDLLKKVSIDQNISSYHWNRDNKEKNNYNEINPGIGLEYKDGDMRYMIGNYLNSLNQNSNYLLAGYTPVNKLSDLGRFSAGVVGGGITGYPTGVVTPAAGLLGSYENGKFGLNLLAVPNVKISGKDVDGFLGIQSRYKF
jgi:hypothetical protein